MNHILNWFVRDQIAFANAATTIDVELGGFKTFSMIVPAALNTLTATFQVWDAVAAAWITTGQTQVLATGYFIPSATQLAALVSTDKFRMSLSGGAAAAGSLQVFKKA